MRVILASNRGTLMELGISPIVTSGLSCSCSRLQDHRGGPGLERRSVSFQWRSEAFRQLITIGEAVAYVVSGMYGDVKDLPVMLSSSLCSFSRWHDRDHS